MSKHVIVKTHHAVRITRPGPPSPPRPPVPVEVAPPPPPPPAPAFLPSPPFWPSVAPPPIAPPPPQPPYHSGYFPMRVPQMPGSPMGPPGMAMYGAPGVLYPPPATPLPPPPAPPRMREPEPVGAWVTPLLLPADPATKSALIAQLAIAQSAIVPARLPAPPDTTTVEPAAPATELPPE